MKWTDDITRGVITALEPVRDHTRIFIQYMNTKWVKDDLYFQELQDIYRQEFAIAPVKKSHPSKCLWGKGGEEYL